MNEITMKLNADKLIRMALQEDITSEDVSTNAVMPDYQLGTVDLICKQDGVIAGLGVYARVFTMLDPETVVDLKCKDGDPVKTGQLLATVQGDIRITGSAVILPCEEVRNDTRDTFVLSGKSRSVIRGIGRETLKPLQKEVSPMKTKTPKKRGVER